MNGDGRPRQYLAIRYDVTARKRAEAQLREQAALAQLGQLAAVVAHEVRNPLAGLRAGLQIIDRRVAEPRDRSAIAAMIQRIDGLNDKLDDLLLFAQPRLARRLPVDLLAMAHEVAVTAQASAGRPEPIPVVGSELTASADPEMLRAALLNLAINACQAAVGKEVELRLERSGRTCRVVIADRGHGIPPAIRERLFEPFVTGRVSGTGLGLAIVKRLVELQDGTIELVDRPGGGTFAIVTIAQVAD
jgi:signal transduction histidine kinase